MVARYTKSKVADRDIEHITAHSFSNFGKRQTIKYMDGLAELLQLLADHPKCGHTFIHSKTGKVYLHYPYVSHVIYYRQRGSDIFIVRILHKRMLPEKHL